MYNSNELHNAMTLTSGRGTIIFVPRSNFDADEFNLNVMQGKIAYNDIDHTLVYCVPGVFSPVADVWYGGNFFDRQVWRLSPLGDD
jgi:hypothetical protein